MIATVTQPLHMRHPEIEFRILSRAWNQMSSMLDNLEIDAALTYIDLEPLSRVTAIPLYRERYRLLVSAQSPLSKRADVSWALASELPLLFAHHRHPEPAHRRVAAAWSRQGTPQNHAGVGFHDGSVHPCANRDLVEHRPRADRAVGGHGADFVAIPIVEPDVVHTIGLVLLGANRRRRSPQPSRPSARAADGTFVSRETAGGYRIGKDCE